MSRSLNKAMLIGRTGDDPEVRTTQNGTKLAKVSLATSRKWKGRDGEQEETQWHRLTFWDKLAEVVEQYVGKGDRLYVEGRIEYSTTEHEGQTRYWTDIVVNELVMLGNTDGQRSTTQSSEPESAPNPFSDDDDLPW